MKIFRLWGAGWRSMWIMYMFWGGRVLRKVVRGGVGVVNG